MFFKSYERDTLSDEWEETCKWEVETDDPEATWLTMLRRLGMVSTGECVMESKDGLSSIVHIY